MQKLFRKAVMLSSVAACAAVLAASGALAQSITVSPASESVAVGTTKQFSAVTTGIQPMGVTWSIGSPAGGTISASGLYTAPAGVPGQTPVSVVATSMGMPLTTLTAYVTVVTAGPVLTSASPNPVTSGTYTITISGSPFVAGAVVNCNGVQLSGGSVTATTISGVGYVASSTSNLSCLVKNPGSAYSNVVSVVVKAASGGGGGGAVPVVSPAMAQVVLGATQQFTAGNVTSWTAVAGTVSAAGLYTAPAQMPASGTDVVTATGPNGTGKANVSLISNVAPVITQLSVPALAALHTWMEQALPVVS